MDNQVGAPETKADMAQAFDDFMHGFEAFKETNDRRLADIETKGVDVITTDKLARIEAALDANQRRMDQLVLNGARPALGGAARGASEHKSAFDGYVRAGDESGIRALEKKALTAAAGDGGFNVPVEVEVEVMRRMALISPIRSIAGVRQVSSASFRKPVFDAGSNTAGWVGESDARTETTGEFRTLQFDTMELYAMPAASTTLLDDSAVDIESWLAEEIEQVFAEQETAAFTVGDGVNKPKGFTTETTVNESSWSWGNIGMVKTGVNGNFPAVNPSDVLIDLIYALKSGYRQNAHFVMNRKTQAAVRKFKDSDGNYIWTPPSAPGTRASLLNFPIVEAEDMPDINQASNRNAIAFGDFRRGYLIVDRTGLRVLRDPYSKKPFVLFYVTKRVGGGIQDYDAIKFLRFAA